MPAGNPAGYLPNVKKLKARLKKAGAKPYKPRARQKPVATIKVPRSPRQARTANPAPTDAPAPVKKAPMKRFDFASPEMSVSRAQYKARTKKPVDLTFAEKYLRRSTDSSRARFAKKAGRKVSARLQRKATGPRARYLGRDK